MNVEEIRVPNSKDGEEPLLAVVVTRPDEFVPPDGSHAVPVSPGREPMQVLVMALDAGHVVPPHAHLAQERRHCTTQETLIVLTGSVGIDFYRSSREWVSRRVIGPGDLAVLLSGGHGLTALTPTRLIEVKTGPYFGRSFDKVDFEPAKEM